MYHFLKYTFLFIALSIIISCATSNSGAQKSSRPEGKYQPTSVQDLLRAIPGVNVVGNEVKVANGNAMLIVNGSRMSYQTLVSTTPVYRIKSSRISKSPTDIKLYTNAPGYTGIIFITTE